MNNGNRFFGGPAGNSSFGGDPNNFNNMNNGMNPGMNNINPGMGMNPGMGNEMNMGMSPEMPNNMNMAQQPMMNQGMNPGMNPGMTNGMNPGMNNMNPGMGMNSMPNQNMAYNQFQNQNIGYNNGSGTSPSPKKSIDKVKLIGIGGIILVIIIIILAVVISGGKKDSSGKGGSQANGAKYKKTLTCSTHSDVIGLVLDSQWVFYINDGEVAIDYSKVYQIDQFHSADYDTEAKKDAFAQQLMEETKEACADNSCKSTTDYKKGKSLKLTISYSASQAKALLGNGLSSKTADEIYTKLKTTTESGELDGSVHTCK